MGFFDHQKSWPVTLTFICLSATCSDFEVGWTVKNRSRAGYLNVVQTWVTPMEFPCHGVVTNWRYWAQHSAPFKAMVLRKVNPSDTLHDIIGINNIPAGDTGQVVTYQVPDDERVVVQAGDVIGFAWNSPGPKHVVQGNSDDDDVETLLFSALSPDDHEVNDRIDASGTVTHQTRAYSIKAIVSGILTMAHISFKW